MLRPQTDFCPLQISPHERIFVHLRTIFLREVFGRPIVLFLTGPQNSIEEGIVSIKNRKKNKDENFV